MIDRYTTQEKNPYENPMFPCIIRTPTLGLIFEEKNAYYTRKITIVNNYKFRYK